MSHQLRSPLARVTVALSLARKGGGDEYLARIEREVDRLDQLVGQLLTLARIDSGHRLRITIRSSETPYLLPLASDMQDLMGGIYEVQRSGQYPSSVNVPLVDPRTLEPSSIAWGNCNTDCGNASPLRR